tara:strand:- start:2125 stop:3462 length:1338 start_codon:yes stop_codon:yes gene_type:complete
MSYKHLEDIQNIYENISEPVNNQLVSEASAILIDSMFSEGYSEDAIAQYALNANPDDIVDKIIVNAENYIYLDASELNESIDGVEYEILEENTQQVVNLQELVEAALLARAAGALSKVARPAARGLAIAGRRAGQLAGKVGSKIADKVKPMANKVATATSGAAASAANTAKTGGKALIGNMKTGLAKTGNAIKKYGPTAAIAGGAGLVGVPLAIGAAKGIARGVGSAVKNVKKFVKGGTDAFKKPEAKPEAKPEVKKDTGLSFGDAIKASQTDAGKELTKSLTPKETPKPTNPSGKVIPKPREVGQDKGQINPNSARGQMIARNKERFGKDSAGNDRVDKLRNKNAAFQAAKKKGSGYSMDDFAKDFPNSNTAKERAKRNRVTSVMDMESYDAFDIVSNYLLESNQVENMDEALYVMSEMDATTIQGIVNEHHQKDENGNAIPHE